MKSFILLAACLFSWQAAAEPFSVTTVPVFAGKVADKWERVSEKIETERATLAACRPYRAASPDEHCTAAVKGFQSIVDGVRGLTGLVMVGNLNRAINLAIRSKADVVDEWSSPLETFARGYGDCEDYALSKLAGLLELGVASENIRFVVLRGKKEDHAVLAVLIDGEWRIMNNLTLFLIKDTDLRDYRPIYIIAP